MSVQDSMTPNPVVVYSERYLYVKSDIVPLCLREGTRRYRDGHRAGLGK